MALPLPRIAAFVLAIAAANAQFITPESVDWEKVRAAQPEGLSLAIDLPQTSYQQGEIIDATLTFSNASSQPYHMWVGTGDRSGRIPDIAIYATDADGNPVADPLRWYFERGGIGGGLGNFQNLGEWKITLPANQWLRFPNPGTFTLRAYSSRVRKGEESEPRADEKDRVDLVSDPVTITLSALDPSEEQRIIGQAVAQLADDRKEADEAATTLRYLDTPASRAALLPALSGPLAFPAMMALYAAPNPAEEAPKILEAIRSGEIKFDPGLVQIYATLETADFRFNPLPKTREEQEALGKKFQDAYRAASEEITAVATAATGGEGSDFYQTLITTLFQDPAKRLQARDELVKVQLDLTPEQGDTLLDNWKQFGGEEFQPLVRKLVAAPFFNPDALQALAQLEPEEARPLIIEDLQRRPPRYLIPKATSRIANAPLLTLPVKPITELETYFREQLKAESPDDLSLLMAAIARYGGPGLLPDVINFYTPKEGRWACAIQEDALIFWLRQDPPAGLAAIKRALAAREKTRCYQRLLSGIFLGEWDAAALPIVTAALDDPDPRVVVSAIEVLEAHADSTYVEPSIVALQRISASATKQNPPERNPARGPAQKLLEGNRWKLNAEQRQQLKEIESLQQ